MNGCLEKSGPAQIRLHYFPPNLWGYPILPYPDGLSFFFYPSYLVYPGYLGEKRVPGEKGGPLLGPC